MKRSACPAAFSALKSSMPAMRSDEPSAEQHAAHLEIDVVVAPMRDHARHRRGDDLRRLRRDRDRRRNAPEHQERRQDEAAADPEHARQEPDGRAQRR